MRNKIIAGNWKMYKDLNESADLLNGLKTKLAVLPNGVKAIVCPPFTSLALAQKLLEGSPIAIGAQNMYHEDEGAFTAEISPKMLKSVGCQYVILGHSERRQYFKETNEIVNKKVKMALLHNLKPIMCIGESLQEFEAGRTEEIVTAILILPFSFPIFFKTPSTKRVLRQINHRC